MAMKTSEHRDPTHHLIAALWALIFAKCFFFEYLVAYYQIPINSALYIWSLTLLMATVATVVYFKINATHAWQRARKALGTVWCFCGSAIGLLIACAFLFDLLSLQELPTWIGAVLAIGYSIQFMRVRRWHLVFSATGWYLGAGLMQSATIPLPLLLFAICLVSFTAAPLLLLYREYKSAIRRAMNALTP
jgi:hypothetical protein